MKGQWFLISAVIASSAFLTISFLFRSYFAADSTEVARINEDFYFHDIKQQFDILANEQDCANYDSNFREFRAFAEREMGNLGYLLYMNFTIDDCSQKKYRWGMLLASERMVICHNVTVAGVLPDSVELSCG